MIPFQFEGEAVGVLPGGKFVLLDGGGGEAAEQVHEPGLEGGDAFLDGAGAGAHLQRRAGEEAPAGEGATLQVFEERLAYRRELGQPGGGHQSGPDDFVGEDPARLLHGGPAGVPA